MHVCIYVSMYLCIYVTHACVYLCIYVSMYQCSLCTCLHNCAFYITMAASKLGDLGELRELGTWGNLELGNGCRYYIYVICELWSMWSMICVIYDVCDLWYMWSLIYDIWCVYVISEIYKICDICDNYIYYIWCTM